MKSTAKKGFLFEAKKLCFLTILALFVVGGVFAQRVGDTVQVGGLRTPGNNAREKRKK